MVSVRSRNGTAEVRMASTLRSSGLHGYRRHWPVAGTPILHGRAWESHCLSMAVSGMAVRIAAGGLRRAI